MCLFNNRLLTQDVNHGYKCLHVPFIYVVSLSASYSTLHGANQLLNEIRHARSIVLGGKKGGIFYKILTSRKKVTSQNYKNSNLWRGKKQVGTYMYCTYNFYFSFLHFTKKIGGASCRPPPSRMLRARMVPRFFLYLYQIVKFVSYTLYVDMAVLQLSRLFVLSASNICMLFIRE